MMRSSTVCPRAWQPAHRAIQLLRDPEVPTVSDELVRIEVRAGAGSGPLALPDGQNARWMSRRLKRNAQACAYEARHGH